MDGVAKRELTEVEMILGKGMLYDSSGLTELVNMYYLRYGIIIEVVWYPNLKKWLPKLIKIILLVVFILFNQSYQRTWLGKDL